MDQYRALRAHPQDDGLRRVHLDVETLQRVTGAGLAVGTTVDVLPAEDLDRLAAGLGPGLLFDRGRKDPRKGLSEYLSKRRGWNRLRADYQKAGQAARGIRALLDACGERETEARHFIGVTRTVFEELWQRASEPAGEAGVSADSGLASEPPPSLADLLAAHPDIKVPESLVATYRGSGREMDLVRRLIVLASRAKDPVLVEGESGTGKEVVARQIHHLSDRTAAKFVAVNCGGIPAELLESELFGHEKGAFTQAFRDKQGLWSDARGGTLFLDEIGDLSLSHQVKVLRALEDGRFRPVGANDEELSDARIIAATNRDLQRMVSAGQFREDLFYRLFTLRIRTPAVREHPEDIPELAQHLWEKLTENKSPRLAPEILDSLKAYPWPGNARELRAFLINLHLVAGKRTPDVTLARLVLRERSGRVRDRATRKDA